MAANAGENVGKEKPMYTYCEENQLLQHEGN